MNVTEAVLARKSIRQFLPTPVADETIRSLLEGASRSPSRSNFQPWRIFVVNGASMDALRADVAGREREEISYQIAPPDMWEPYYTARYDVAQQIFDKSGLREVDKDGRLEHLHDTNHKFFDAPAGLFCFVDKRMGKAQWTDLGMFLQTFMLLAQEAGLDTCAQEYWAFRSEQVSTFVDAPDELMLVCGMAIGHRDPDAEVNSVVAARLPLDEFATFV